MNYQGQNAAYPNQSGLAQGNTVSSAPQPKVSELMMKELSALLGKCQDIHIRQINLRDRLFGSQPENPTISGKESAPAFLHQANDKMTDIRSVLDGISECLAKLEQLA